MGELAEKLIDDAVNESADPIKALRSDLTNASQEAARIAKSNDKELAVLAAKWKKSIDKIYNELVKTGFGLPR